ncbi:MAG: glycosyltransferase [Betaproteobacteria bacterium]|nr:glycosyltransferase [Betaproteobacteria bacterium]
MPKVSVILTSFNHNKYIREAIDSVLNQAFTDYELIIWDDASSDGSWAVINSYSDLRIKAFRNEATKRGIYGINKAIFEVATGEYIAIHHSDDVWELDKLEKQVSYLDNHCEIGAVFTWAQIIDENGAKLKNNWFQQENKTRWQWLNQLFLEQNHLNHPSVLIRKQCYQDVGAYRYGLAQTGDAEMWSRVLIKFPIHVIQENLTKHRLLSDKSNTSGSRIEVAIRASNEWNVLRENYLSISNIEDIVATFPSLQRFRNTEGADNVFLLAMACLYECQQKNAWNFGLKLLFDLFNDETRRNKILEIYSFSYVDFIRLTDEFDVYELRSLAELEGQVANLNQAVAERGGQITNLTQAVAKFDERIASINQAVAEEIQRLNSVVLAKDGAIEVQAEEIRQLSSELKDTRHEVAQHTEEINSLRSLLAQRDQLVDTLNNSLRHMEGVLTNVKEELLRAEAELQVIRRTKWFRLRDAIIHQPWGFRKIARVAYLAGVMAVPPLIRARLSPSVFRIRARLNALRPALLSNSNENGAYLVLQPAPAVLNRPHVAHIIANFMTGGSSRLVVDLIEYLGVHYEQSVVTSYIPTPPAYIGVDITEFRFPENEQLFIDHFSQLKPDLLHVHYWGDCDEPWYKNAIAAAEHLDIPIIENINTPVTPYVSDAVRRYVYVSDYVRHVFGQNHPSHITVYPGSDFSHFDRKSGERLADDCIGMVYRMERDKLNEGAIVPFIKAVQKRPQTRVLIVGGGSLLEPFRHAVAKAGLNDNFEFTGYVSYDALPDLYRRMSVFVAPVWKESFGQVSAFAMNMRIPVVGYDIGAIGEIVANQALLAEPENPEMLSDIIVRLLESPAEREKLGELQRCRAQDYFSVQAMIKAYGAIYQEMMAEHTPKIYERVV